MYPVDNGAGGFVEMAANCSCASGRGGVSSAFQEDIDVAHRDALLPDKVERVVEHAFDVRQMGFLDLLVPGPPPRRDRSAEPGGPVRVCAGLDDAPELAARVDGDRRSLEPPVAGLTAG